MLLYGCRHNIINKGVCFLRKQSRQNKLDEYLSQKGKHPVPKPPTKSQKFLKWLLYNLVGIISLIVAIIIGLKK